MSTLHLKNGVKVLVDKADLDRLSHFTWWKMWHNDYICATTWKDGKKRGILLHRFIINAPKELEVDHINGNPLDNRRVNLRLCTRAENARNRKMHKNNTSGFTGVYWDKRRNKWRVKLQIDGKLLSFGYFTNKEDARKVREKEAKRIFKEFNRIETGDTSPPPPNVV